MPSVEESTSACLQSKLDILRDPSNISSPIDKTGDTDDCLFRASLAFLRERRRSYQGLLIGQTAGIVPSSFGRQNYSLTTLMKYTIQTYITGTRPDTEITTLF